MSDKFYEVKAAPNPHIIEMLEGLVKEAKDGDIQGICIAGAMTNARTFNCFEVGGYTMALVGEIAILQRDVIDCCVSLRAHDVGD